MKKMLVVNYEFPPLGGGGGIGTYEIAKEFTKDYEVHCLTSGAFGLPGYEVVDNIHVHRTAVRGRKNRSTATFSSMLSYVYNSIKIARSLCEKHKFDCLWTVFAVPSGLPGTWIAKKFNIPHLLTVVGGDIFDPSKKMSPHKHFFLRKMVSHVINSANFVVAISNDTKNRALQYYNIKKDIQVIPLGFTPCKVGKVKREVLGLDESSFYFIAIGRLVKRKGFSYLIEALSLLKDRDTKLIILGDGPLLGELKAKSRDLGILDRVVLPGLVEGEKKYQYLSTSDCFVLSSLHEGLGLVVQEAMFCGLPIVSTDVGGQTDLLKNGENAFLVPVNSSSKLAEAMNKIKADETLRTKFGKNNLSDVENFFVEPVALSYRQVLQDRLGI